MKGSRNKRLRVGFVPLVDCAPLVMAHELGLFAKYGLDVSLSREIGWASVRDKIVFGELEASQAVAGMVVAATRGMGSIPCECLTALVLNLHGNAITLSEKLYARGVREAGDLRQIAEEDRGRKTYTFGVVFPFSSHNFLLRQWLQSGGIDPEQDVRIVVVPPSQMCANLRAGHLDGFCVGEPWNSVAIQARAGFCVAVSSQLAPLHPEKVLMVRADFAEQRAGEHRAMVAALVEACAYCDDPDNRPRIAAVLAGSRYVAAPVGATRSSLVGPFDCGHGRVIEEPEFHLFHRHHANDPSADKADWVLAQMGMAGVPASFSARLFRRDIYRQAKKLTQEMNQHETKSHSVRETALV